MEITRQADAFGLPDNSPPPVPSAEHVADVLAKPVPWSGPAKVASEEPPYSDVDSRRPPGWGEQQHEVESQALAEHQQSLSRHR